MNRFFKRLLSIVRRGTKAATEGDVGALAAVATDVLDLAQEVGQLAELGGEAQQALKEYMDVGRAVVPVALAAHAALMSGNEAELPSDEQINYLQGQRVEADMAMGRLIGSIPTRPNKPPTTGKLRF